MLACFPTRRLSARFDWACWCVNLGKKEGKTSEEEKKLILLDFWYISCPPCIKSIPVINEIKNNYDKSKIDVIPVNCIDKVELIRKFVNKNKINFNDQYIAEKEVLEKLKIGSFPTFILLNNQGHELGRVEGINNLKENLVLMINLNPVR